MRIVDLSMTVEECDSAPFAKDEYYFKLRPIVTWEDKGFVSNLVEMTVHAGTHIDSPHHFFRDMRRSCTRSRTSRTCTTFRLRSK